MRNVFNLSDKDSLLSEVGEMTHYEKETEEEKAEREAAERKASEEATEKAQVSPQKQTLANRPKSREKASLQGKSSNSPDLTIQTNSQKNWNKFTPDCINIRSGPFNTLSDLFSLWTYENSLDISRSFSYIIDDKSCEEDSSVSSTCSSFDLAVGLNCEYLLMKGFRKPERYSKITHYMAMF